MSITKESKIDKIEIVGGVNIQVREIVTVKENGDVISQSYNREVFQPSTFSVDPQNGNVTFKDTDLSGKPQQIQDIAGLQWTDANKKAWKDQIIENNKKS
jgi:hypothetical protein|tara:strand:- start:73 stop:372 length:300 start_codon:yes stop_codon:yes gene_type:complete